MHSVLPLALTELAANPSEEALDIQLLGLLLPKELYDLDTSKEHSNQALL